MWGVPHRFLQRGRQAEAPVMSTCRCCECSGILWAENQAEEGPMANKADVDRLRQGAERWNQWREQHPKKCPDLNSVNLSRVDLGLTDLNDALLIDANLAEANL